MTKDDIMTQIAGTDSAAIKRRYEIFMRGTKQEKACLDEWTANEKKLAQKEDEARWYAGMAILLSILAAAAWAVVSMIQVMWNHPL